MTRKKKQSTSGDSSSGGASRNSASGSSNTNVYQKVYRTDSASLEKAVPLSRKRSTDSSSQKSIKSYWPNDASGMSGMSSEQPSIPSSSIEFSDYGPSSVPKKTSPGQKKTSKRAPTPPTNSKGGNHSNGTQPVLTHHQPIPNGISQGQRIQQLELQLDERRRENEARVTQLQQRLTEVPYSSHPPKHTHTYIFSNLL